MAVMKQKNGCRVCRFILLIVALALSACSERQKATSVVKDFLDTHLAHPGYAWQYCSVPDSTYFITDSIVHAMRNQTAQSTLFKPIRYDGERTKKLMFVQVKYENQGKKIKQTFYLDDRFTYVVSLKDD